MDTFSLDSVSGNFATATIQESNDTAQGQGRSSKKVRFINEGGSWKLYGDQIKVDPNIVVLTAIHYPAMSTSKYQVVPMIIATSRYPVSSMTISGSKVTGGTVSLSNNSGTWTISDPDGNANSLLTSAPAAGDTFNLNVNFTSGSSESYPLTLYAAPPDAIPNIITTPAISSGGILNMPAGATNLPISLSLSGNTASAATWGASLHTVPGGLQQQLTNTGSKYISTTSATLTPNTNWPSGPMESELDILGYSYPVRNLTVYKWTTNNTPGASIAASPSPGYAQQTVSFTATCNITSCASYSWNFGDGSPTNSQQNPSHTFASAGTYSVTLTTTNGSGGSSRDTLSFTVSPRNAKLNGDYTYFQMVAPTAPNGTWSASTANLTFNGDSTGTGPGGAFTYSVGATDTVSFSGGPDPGTYADTTPAGDIMVSSDGESTYGYKLNIAVKKSTGMSNASLNGTYIVHQFMADSNNTTPSTSRTSVTFDGNGNFTYVELVNSHDPPTSGSGTYTVASDGTLSLEGDTGIVSTDGDLVVTYHSDSTYSMIMVGVKTSTAMSSTAFDANWHVHDINADYSTASWVGGTVLTQILNTGAGTANCSTIYDTATPVSPGSCTYSVASDGTLTLTGDESVFTISPQGDIAAGTDAIQTGDNWISLAFFIRKP